ncbi:MAG: beta-galactosidase [Kiritimatiellae bacterium]|nr:beta-galactosidase [Kiritimatiellia bacterium]
MLILGSQYYRPPTPDPSRWESDLRRMREAGLNTVQLWAVWGWIEPEPGRFVYDDYDRLFDLADQNGLKVVVSTITDVQPFWIPTLHPHTHMVDAHGLKVIGTPRGECLPGLTPGHCTDHAEIRELSMRFMRELARHFAGSPALAAWDCWNEARWCVHCERWVCYCDASLKAFREFLRQRYGDLETLGRAWGRRLRSWDDVSPAKAASMISPAVLDFDRWLIHRARETAAWRCRALREGDPVHPIAAHVPASVTRERQIQDEEPPFARGNDFDLAAEANAFGTSTFPAWWQSDPTDIGVLLEVTRSVSQPHPFWLSELQGGAFNQGFHYGLEVPGPLQQFWTWSAYARGAQAVLYWCWRDEVWGIESGGYGITGQDGRADERVRELQVTARLLREHEADLEAYAPDPAQVGVVFDSDSVLLALHGRDGNADAATFSINGTLKALERRHLAYDLLDGRNLVIPDGLRLLLLPAAFCLKEQAAGAIADFLQRGGHVFCEAGTGMFAENGFYRDDPALRPLVGKLGLRQGRRRSTRADAACAVPPNTWGRHDGFQLRGGIWSLALEVGAGGRAVSRDPNGEALLVEVRLAKGALIMSGTFPAHAYHAERYEGFETLLSVLAARAGAVPAWQIKADRQDGLFVRAGRCGARRLVFLLTAGGPASVSVLPSEEHATIAREWVTGAALSRAPGEGFAVDLPPTGYRVLEWEA